ncbi:MAG: glycosyltransferase family 4 protein [Pleurocapsa sp.]
MVVKIFFINQPWTEACPPRSGDSTGIWTYQISQYLAQYFSVVYYGQATTSLKKKSQFIADIHGIFSIEYRGIYPNLDDRIKLLTKITTKLDFCSHLPYFASTWFYWGYGWQIAKDIARQKSNSKVVHIHNHSQFIAPLRKYNPQSKIILHMHCEWVNRLNQKAIAKRLAKVDLVISCSNYVTNKIKERFPQYAAICRTVNNGVDANYFVPNPRQLPKSSNAPPQLLFVGRISPEKGIHDLIEAFIQVTVKYPQAILKIIGAHIVVAKEFLFDLQPEPEVQALKYFYSINYLEYVKSLVPAHLADQVIFIDGLPQAQLLPYYQQADVVINPSLSEAFGMSLVEAMSTETPVVATKIGGMTEIVDDGVTGVLTEPGQPQALAAAICKIIADPIGAEAMGKAGRIKVQQRYSWEQIARSLIAHYADIGVDFPANGSQKTVARSL